MIGEVSEVVKEPENEYDPSATSVKRINGLSSYVVGHIGRHISKVVFQFLSLPGSAPSGTVSGMRVNRGAGDVLKIPISVKFIEHSKSIEWIKKKINYIENEINRKVEKWYEVLLCKVSCELVIKMKFTVDLFTVFKGCPL